MNFLKRHIDIITIVLLLIIEILPLTIIIYFVSIPSTLFQILLYSILLIILSRSFFDFHIEWRLLLFIIIAIISIILSDVSQKYDAPMRLATWVILVSSVGPLLYNSKLINFRKKLLETTMYIFMIIGGVSFLYWVVGLPHLGRGHFTGITIHSMLLAPIASMGGIYAIYRFFKTKIYNIQKIIFALLFMGNTVSVFLAASRSALAGYIFGLIILLFFQKFHHKQLITIMVLIVSILGFLLHEINKSPDKIRKHSNEIVQSMEDRGLQNTRESLWKQRLKEFNDSPVFGVGFASEENKVVNIRKINKSGKIEPGSTYLMILSMTGLAGVISMLFFFSKILFDKKFWKVTTTKEIYKLAVLGFFLIHFLAEGYLFASGALMAFVFWTLIGSIYPYPLKNITKENNK